MPVFPFPFTSSGPMSPITTKPWSPLPSGPMSPIPSGHSYGFIGAYDVMRGKSPGTYFNKADADLLPYHGGITIKIAPSGTKYTNEAGKVSESRFGHAWVEFQGESIGWGLGDDKSVGGVDNLTFRDSMAYDASGDGIATIAENGNLFFDHDNNGIIESSGWIESNSAFLVWDKNKDGKINNGNELFGNNSILKNGTKADNGFAALADLDDNNDGIFDQNDSLWNSLELWIDANRDAITDSGELHKLSESGISSINLAHKENGFKDINGNIHGLESTVNWDNGNVTKIVDVYFAVNKNKTIESVTSHIDIVGVNDTFSEAIL
ncbi:hypothetical protein [Xenorhabdus thailandensis]|uniref:hypothetical protein n=1 Tax=Xenorhabdus thailandensis TaxID=3136255 RepID=UPI0030F3B184